MTPLHYTHIRKKRCWGGGGNLQEKDGNTTINPVVLILFFLKLKHANTYVTTKIINTLIKNVV